MLAKIEYFDVFNRLEEGQSISLLAPDSVLSFPAPQVPSLGLLTSGTTGEPKLIWHPWHKLKETGVVHPACQGWTWSTPFQMNTYAGIQVAVQAWLSRGEIVSLSRNWQEVFTQLKARRPEALCCTPTFLNLLFLHCDTGFDGWVPRQLTVGGEPFRKQSGDQIKTLFAGVGLPRFTNVYASAELGVIAKSNEWDGCFKKEAFLNHCQDVEVCNGLIRVRKEDQWIETGDEADAVQGGFRIVGRAGFVANVGGVKVNLSEVERKIAEVHGVLSVQAWAESNPVSGEIVAMRYCPMPGIDPKALEARIELSVRENLPKAAWPRVMEVGEPVMGGNAKAARRRTG